MVEALLAAGASVEAKNIDGCGPQRRDGCDRTDVVGRRCTGEMWKRCDTTLSLLPVLGTSFQESSVDFIRDCMLRSQVPVDTSYKFDNIIQSGSGG